MTAVSADVSTDRPPSLAAPAPLVFTGEDGFIGAELLSTSTIDRVSDSWVDSVVTELNSGERALVSLSFAPDGPAVAHRVRPGAEGLLPLVASGPSADMVEHQVREVPSADAYAAEVRRALELIDAGPLEKVVLGRCLEVTSRPPLAPAQVVARLLEQRPGRYVFSLPLTDVTDAGNDVDGPVLVGASPELLVRRTGSLVASMPLAGSVPRIADPVVDRERADALRESAKDLHEHAFVVEQIVRELSAVCTEVDAPEKPELIGTDTLWHLASPIRARLSDSARLSALQLARLLHPTPAVGGVPIDHARATIADLEGERRGPLAGAVGWVGPDGDGELAVTIRAGMLQGEQLRLFAGAGIVTGSDPLSEVRETGAKLSTMARAVGLGELR